MVAQEQIVSGGMQIGQQIATTLVDAFVEAGMSGQRAKPALMAKQGARNTYMLSLPVGELLDLVILRNNRDEGEMSNRPTSDSWVRSIERGLRRKLALGPDKSRYVLFPFTGNIPEGAASFRSLYQQPGLADIGILMLPRSVKIEIADGGHRVLALRNLVQDIPWLADEAVDLFLIEESDMLQQRTDFSDGAKVLPINVTLQAWFDTGVPLNAATHSVVSKSNMIGEGDIEKFKAGVSGRNTRKLWTYNGLRGYVGTALVRGTPQKTEELADAFDTRTAALGWGLNSVGMEEYTSEIAGYLDLALEVTAGGVLAEARKNPDVIDWDTARGTSLLLKSAGLNTFGLLVHDLREKAKEVSDGSERSWVEDHVRRACQFGWGQMSDTFKGTLVRGGKINGSSTASYHAVIVLEAKLGILDGIPRRTAESLLSMYDSGELSISIDERNAIRMARRD